MCELGAEHTQVLNEARVELEEAEQHWERKLDEVEEGLKGPHEICALCQCVIRRGEKVVRLLYRHVFHEKCMLPKLSDGTVTCCPLDRIPVERAAIRNLRAFAWGSNE